MLSIALTLAAAGLPVFPCTARKTPAIAKDNGGSGYRDATTDPARIRDLWRRAGDAAQLVGVPTGSASGFDVLDMDPRHDPATAGALQTSAGWPETRTHRTMSGGRHWLFRHRPGVRNSISKAIAPGVDVRGEGGYVIIRRRAAMGHPRSRTVRLAGLAAGPRAEGRSAATPA